MGVGEFDDGCVETRRENAVCASQWRQLTMKWTRKEQKYAQMQENSRQRLEIRGVFY